MLTIDGRCEDPYCSNDMYRMVGHCRNCGTGDILLLFTSGHETRPLTCPVCGCYHEVCSDRLATDDEFPEASPVPVAEAPVYEIERDRHGLMYSGPLKVGECVRVRPIGPSGAMGDDNDV
jgi:hypothetical protein